MVENVEIVKSEYFKSNDITNNINDINDTIINKNIRVFQNYCDTNRSICQMLRNINYHTNYKDEIIIAKIINFVDKAVLNLSNHKEQWSLYLKNDSVDNIYKGRSNITDKKIEESIFIINNNDNDNNIHNVFKLYKILYDNYIIDNNIKLLILECVYYTQQINKK